MRQLIEARCIHIRCNLRSWTLWASEIGVVQLFELLIQDSFLLVNVGEVAIVKCIAMLLHKHRNCMQSNKDRMRPRPSPNEGKANESAKKKTLPNILYDPTRPVPIDVAIEDEHLDHQTHHSN